MKPHIEELNRIATDNGGVLNADDVVEFARDPETALHSHFDWDDAVAGEAYRREQARRLIRVYVTVLPNTSEEVRAFVSLSSDRKSGGGYRTIEAVLSDEDLTAVLIDDARRDFERFRRKYETLAAIAPALDALADAIEIMQRTTRKAVAASA